MTISGATRVAGVIGDPVRHSRSPAIFNAAFAATGLDWVYVAFEVTQGSEAVAAMPVLGIRGLNVTMPHKAAAAAACDELSDAAATLGVVNTCVLNQDGTVSGDSTDGEGFLRALADSQVEPRGAEVCVVGAGGAARSIVYALDGVGARVAVAARRMDAAEEVAELATQGRALPLEGLASDLAGFDILVNATPVGMRGESAPFPVGALAPDAFVFDTVYVPDPTPLVAEARAAGRRAVTGLDMLVHQAALAFERFTGQSAPLDAMRSAATVGA